jgi:hypothetical protein
MPIQPVLRHAGNALDILTRGRKVFALSAECGRIAMLSAPKVSCVVAAVWLVLCSGCGGSSAPGSDAMSSAGVGTDASATGAAAGQGAGGSGASTQRAAGGAPGSLPMGGAAAVGASATAGASGAAAASDPTGGSAGSQGAAGAKALPTGTRCDMPSAGGPAPQASGQPRLQVTLAPHRDGDAVDYVDVSLTVEAPNVFANQALLRLPMVFAGVESARYESADLSVEDDMGMLPLSQVDEPVDPTNFVYYRRWQPQRATVGDLSVRYRAPTRAFVPVLGSGPPFDLRPEAGGLAGAGVSFLALPDTGVVYSIGVHWDLTGMPDNTRGVFSRGEGDVELTGPVELLAYAFYLAGPVSSYPVCANGPFQAFWLSEPPFDMQDVAQWTESAYGEIATFFRDADKPYLVFFRHNEGGAIGGAALPGSFMVGYADAPAPTAERLRAMLAHEIVHNWPSTLNDTASEWFGEGMAEHYSAAITLRAGLITPDAFLGLLNAQALSYYANPLRDLPSSEVADRFWSDTRVRKIPYDRGALYFGIVDAAVRASSNGDRSLDDLTFAMLDRRDSGQSYDSAAWRALISSELGTEGIAQYEAMLAGELLMPPGNAYGPCFSNEQTMYPQFELGFDPKVLSETPRVVTTVTAGSNAEQAGLQTGDEITAPVVLDDVLTNPDAELTVKVRRAGADMDIRYVPRGAAVSGVRWTRVVGVPDSECAL